MEEPMIFFLLYLTEEPLGSFGRVDFPPDSCSMKVIPMKKKKDRIFSIRILKKIFRQDDERTLSPYSIELKKRSHIEPGIDTSGMASGKENRKTLGLQNSRGVEHQRLQGGRQRRQGRKPP